MGIFLFTGGLLILLMGISWGGVQYPWTSAHVLATITVGFLTLAVFVLYGTVVSSHVESYHVLTGFQNASLESIGRSSRCISSATFSTMW